MDEENISEYYGDEGRKKSSVQDLHVRIYKGVREVSLQAEARMSFINFRSCHSCPFSASLPDSTHRCGYRPCRIKIRANGYVKRTLHECLYLKVWRSRS